MGEVYLAQHLTLQKPVALKMLPPSRGTSEHVQRFFREARICSRIEHPNVVPIYNVGQEDEFYFIVMQYVDGKTLTQIIQMQEGALPWLPALRLFRLAAKGVGAVHKRGLIHRDIKPSNIMVTNESRVLLMDFGLVRETTHTERTAIRATAGTPAFMSPEQCRGRSLDARSDIFSLGSTLYYLLTGEVPYTGAMRWILVQIGSGKKPPPVREVNPSVPAEVSEFVDKVMSFEPDDRFADGNEFAKEIGRLIKTLDSATATGASPSSGDSEASLHITPDLVPLVAVLDETSTGDGRSDPGRIASQSTVESMNTDTSFPELSEPDARSASRSRRRKRSSPLTVAVSALLLLLVLGLLSQVLISRGVEYWNPPPEKNDQRAAGGSGDGNPCDQPFRHIFEGGEVVAVETCHDGQPKRIDMSRMVRIPTGNVVIGDDAIRLENAIAEIGTMSQRPDDMDELIMQRDDLTQAGQPATRRVGAFWIDKYEVTNFEYASFIEATGYPAPESWGNAQPPPGKDDHPVVGVGYASAREYARWAGKRLPGLEHWVRAFRGEKNWFYPWGDEFDPWTGGVDSSDGNLGAGRPNVIENGNAQGTTPVGDTPKDVSLFGVFNLVGNVREIIYERAKIEKDTFLIQVKGADWNSEGEVDAIGSLRRLLSEEEMSDYEIGFRCVLEIPLGADLPQTPSEQ